MLIPQFTLRWVLAVMAGLSLVFLAMSLAVRGHGWAVGLSVVFVAVAVIMALHALVFGLTWLVAVVTAAIRQQPIPPAAPPVSRGSPFVADGRGAQSPFKGSV
jgi:hypothetical protein